MRSSLRAATPTAQLWGGIHRGEIVFTGGSAYGEEEAITAVATAMKELGLRGGDWNNVAFVPGAVIYDFGSRRLNEIYPYKRLAHAVRGAGQVYFPSVHKSKQATPAALNTLSDVQSIATRTRSKKVYDKGTWLIEVPLWQICSA